MAPLVRPPEFVRWSTDETNDTEPAEAKKDTGYTVNEQPSSAETNWLLRLAGEMQEWLRQRLDDGATVGDFTITPPAQTASGDGGDLTLKGSDGLTAGHGGGLDLFGGDGDGAVKDGGDVTITGGVAGGAVGTGGSVVISGGVSNGAVGRVCEIGGGDANGTDNNGGDLTVKAGQATGSGSGDVVLSAGKPGATGTALRAVSEFLRLDGSLGRLLASQRIELGHSDNTRGLMRVTPVSGLPSAPVSGDVANDSDAGNKLAHYDGTNWEWLHRKRLVATTSVTISTDIELTNTNYTIPADTLKVGDVIRCRFAGAYTPVSGVSLAINLLQSDSSIITQGVLIFSGTTTINWVAEYEMVIRSLGVSGAMANSAMTLSGIGTLDGSTTRESQTTRTINTTIANQIGLAPNGISGSLVCDKAIIEVI